MRVYPVQLLSGRLEFRKAEDRVAELFVEAEPIIYDDSDALLEALVSNTRPPPFYRRMFHRRLAAINLVGPSGKVLDASLAYYFVEEVDEHAPPEIRSRRMQEVEAEWLRLGGLLEQLRKMEASR